MLKTGMHVRQTQAQRISPTMMLEFSLLQMPIGELREAVTKEVNSNPALEIADDFTHYRRMPPSLPSKTTNDGDKEGFLENIADERGETLDEHLLSELRLNGVTGYDLTLARALVAMLDENGRLTGTMADLRMTTGATEEAIERVRQMILATDPLGCGAKDLAECYRAQLTTIPAAKREAVSKAIDYVVAKVENRAVDLPPPAPPILKILSKFNPYPGRLYDRQRTVFVTPDIYVDSAGNVDVDQSDVPDLRISAKYVAMAQDKELAAETRTYAAERVRRAREFHEALVRRKATMETIAVEVIGRQSEFLARGTIGLHKLTMSEIATQVGCDVSTVSRAAARKYVKTPHGTLPLRKFFQLVNQEPIEKLRELLATIPSGTHISDDKIAAMMTKNGYKMARRTVTKYRNRFNALTSEN